MGIQNVLGLSSQPSEAWECTDAPRRDIATHISVESDAFSSILSYKYYSLVTDCLDLNFISDSVDGVRLLTLNFEVTVKGISEFAETSYFRDDFNARSSASIAGCGDQEGPFCSQSVK